MTKKLLKLLGFAAFMAILFLGCRSESDPTENKIAQSETAQKFYIFQNKSTSNTNGKNAEEFDYANIFAFMAQRFDSINKTNITGLVNTDNIVSFDKFKKQNFILENSSPYIDFRIHSKVLKYENGDVAIMYPKINKGQVVDLVVANLSENESKLYFSKVKEENSLFTDNISNFQQVYNQNFGANNGKNDLKLKNLFGKGGETDIEEVIIVVHTGGGGHHFGFPSEGLGQGDGGHCGGYDMCNPPADEGGGGGNDGNDSGLTMPPPPEDPINDIRKFLSCLNINQPANLSVYSQNMISSPPGHAFISISQGGNTMTFGFYPKNGFPGYLNGPSVFGNDSGHPYSYGWNAGQISAVQLQQIIGQVIAFSNSDYGLQNNNCSDFVNYVLQIKGINTNANGIDTPDSIGKLIAPYAQNTKGNAPQTQRTCP